MRIREIRSFCGRNIYSHKPVIKMVVDIGELHRRPTKDIKGFNNKLLEMFPGLQKHFCSPGFEGGFVQRLEEGTYIGHVAEHLILEMQVILGYDVSFGKTRVIEEPSLYYIVYEYVNEKCGIECGRAAISLVGDIIAGNEINAGRLMENIRISTVQAELGPSTKAIYEEARKRGIPVTRLGNDSVLQLGYGKYRRLIEASLTDQPSCIAVDIAGNKHLTKEILSNNGIPVPEGEVAYTEESAVSSADHLGYPVVVKPYDGNQGKGVALNLENEAQVRRAFAEAIKVSRGVIVERFIRGRDYRVLVIGDKVAAVSERRPPAVAGDGVHSIRELVELENSNPLRGEDHEKPLTKIKLDAAAMQTLGKRNLDTEYVPREGEAVFLRENGNLSTGGTARSCMDEIHPRNIQLAVKAAKALGLDIAGIDITAVDIKEPINDSNGAVIEVNAAPGLRMHLYPSEGEKCDVAADILDMLFPDSQKVSVPIVSVTGTNGKTTTTRLIGHTLSLAGKTVGMTSTSGIFVGGKCTLKGDNTGALSAKMVLSDKTVEAAVLETARGGIVKKGLGYDLADVGVVINISDDHLGLNGVNTLEDMAFIKALVVEAVKPEGYSVLNADDGMTGYLLKRAAGNKILFSQKKENPLVTEHLEGGGTALYEEKGIIYINHGGEEVPLIDIDSIPITFNGLVKCNVENSLAAASALFGLGLPLEAIRLGLATFKPDVQKNPGRFNLFDMGNFRVMLDYSHNTAGYGAVAAFIEGLGAKRLVGVIGMPGDRLDSSIRQVGEISGRTFSKIYIKEDVDLRGREAGETARLLVEGVLAGGLKKENIEVVLEELKALETAILDAQPGDLIVMFYEEFEPAFELVDRFRKELDSVVIPEAMLLAENIQIKQP